MQILLPTFCLFLLINSCSSQQDSIKINSIEKNNSDKMLLISEVDAYYLKHKQDSVETKSIGSVSNGSLVNGTIIPFSGSNYSYFDTTSYLGGRAFTHQTVAKIILNTFAKIEADGVTRKFKVMEFSNEHGGKMYPHRTHQNGFSVDLMMPLKKNNKPYYELDNLGAMHYLLEFNTQGQYVKDTTISIDFEMVAREIMTMDRLAKKNGFRIQKVIFNTFLWDELTSTSWGQILINEGPYFTRKLEKVINDIHDDHFHIDFQPI